jgi:hypothetical protein
LLAHVGENFIPRAPNCTSMAACSASPSVLSLFTGFALGLFPAIQASRTDPNESLKDSTRGSTGGRQAGRLRSILLVAEVALSLVLLVGAALLIDSFRRCSGSIPASTRRMSPPSSSRSRRASIRRPSGRRCSSSRPWKKSARCPA